MRKKWEKSDGYHEFLTFRDHDRQIISVRQENMKNTIIPILTILIILIPLFLFPENLQKPEKQILRFFDINGNQIDLSKTENRAILLLFFNPSSSQHKGILVYAHVLNNKYKKMGLQIIGLASKEREKIKQLSEYFSFPLILDEEKKIHNKFNIGDCCGGTVLLDQEKNIKFRTQRVLLSKENLRQIIEKELLGNIKYDFVPVEQNFFFLRQKAPKINLHDIKSNNKLNLTDFREKFLIVTFFSSVCRTCSSGSRIYSLAKLKNDLKKKLRKDDYKILLVFMNPFNISDINDWEKSIPMPFAKYIAQDIFSDEEKYITNNSKKTDPLTIVLNERKEVVFLEEPGMKNEVVMQNIKKVIGGS